LIHYAESIPVLPQRTSTPSHRTHAGRTPIIQHSFAQFSPSLLDEIMKKLFVFAVAGVLGFFVYQHLLGPAEIVNPVFAEIRVKIDVSGREIEAAIFGKMANDADCRQRAERVRDNLDANCKNCASKSIECKASLAPRYAKFFDDTPSSATYLSVTRSSRSERDVRLILWGLTGAEGDAVCDQMKLVFAKIHSGPMKCVHAISS
jgi:hypothetical protein